jgi:predicted nuclease of predicted toxin-antitoxin system
MPWVNIEASVRANPPRERERREVEDFVRRGAKPRFYADENFPSVATECLRRLGADVVTVKEARLTGHPDENHVAEALRLGRILITCDRDYLDERRFPLIGCPAIVVCDFGSGTAGEIFDTFDCLGGAFRAPQFYDKWIKIDAKRDGWTEFARFRNGSTSRTRQRVYGGKIQEWIKVTTRANSAGGRRMAGGPFC